MLGFTLGYLIPGGALVLLVVLGQAQPTALIAAAVMIGFAVLRIYAFRAN